MKLTHEDVKESTEGKDEVTKARKDNELRKLSKSKNSDFGHRSTIRNKREKMK